MSQEIYNISNSEIIITTDLLFSEFDKIKEITEELEGLYNINYKNWQIFITFNDRYIASDNILHYNKENVVEDISKIFYKIKKNIENEKEIKIKSNLFFNMTNKENNNSCYFVDVDYNKNLILLFREKEVNDYKNFLKEIIINCNNKIMDNKEIIKQMKEYNTIKYILVKHKNFI